MDSVESVDDSLVSTEETPEEKPGDEKDESGSVGSDWSETPPPVKIHCLERPNVSRRQFPTVPAKSIYFYPDSGTNIRVNFFDSHCHLDRTLANIYGISPSDFHGRKGKMLKILEKYSTGSPLNVLKLIYPQAFSKFFEGCIHVNCDPRYFEEKYWDWIVESGITKSGHQGNSQY